MAGIIVLDRQKPGENDILGCGIAQGAQVKPPPGSTAAIALRIVPIDEPTASVEYPWYEDQDLR